MSSNVKDRLRTVDERGHRLWVYADIFDGPLREKRKLVAYLLIIVYLSLPWFRINGVPIFQFDIINQKLILFHTVMGFNEVYIVLPLLFGFVFSIFAITTVKGRLWCGWACPQSVFLDFIYRPIEKLVEGRWLERKKLDQEKPSTKKFRIKAVKWAYYFVISFFVANTFIAYFSGRDELLKMLMRPPSENPVFFGAMLLVFAFFLFNFGWFREQMCTIVCPYGRFQSVLLDKNSTIIAYDYNRGEPRGKSGKGDCVDCMRCVQVCPTGIDIRDGLQLECINCAACIDACNHVMNKIKKPQGLIKYTTEQKLSGIVGASKPSTWRLLLYSILTLSFVSFSIYGIAFRDSFDAIALRPKQAPLISSNGWIQNQESVILQNKTSSEIEIHITSEDNANQYNFITPQNPVKVAANSKIEVPIFISAPKEFFKGGIASAGFRFSYKESSKTQTFVIFGPENKETK